MAGSCARGVIYDKGLGMHSPSRVVYRLDGQYVRFAAELAIDDRAGDQGSVVFRIFSEAGQGTWNEVFTSRVVRGGEAPVPISVDIRQARHIALVVEQADRGDQLDRANWLDARLVRQEE